MHRCCVRFRSVLYLPIIYQFKPFTTRLASPSSSSRQQEQNEIHNHLDLRLNEEDYRGEHDLNIDVDLLAFREVQPRVAPAPKMPSRQDNIDKENQRPRVNTLSPRATQGLDTLQDPCNNISQTQTVPTGRKTLRDSTNPKSARRLELGELPSSRPPRGAKKPRRFDA